MRRTLEKYLGKKVIITGVIDGAPINHERTGIEFDAELKDYPKYKKNVLREGEEIYFNSIPAITFPEKGTCLIRVKGMYEFSDIDENHINIMEDLMERWGLSKGDSIIIAGRVLLYEKDIDVIDYCLVDIERMDMGSVN